MSKQHSADQRRNGGRTGVIDSFSTGLSIVGRYPWLLLLPILLDLFFWFGPSLALGPELIETVTAPFDPDGPNAAQISAATATDLATYHVAFQSQLEGINLWTLLVSPLLFWPTLLAPQGSGVSGAIQVLDAGNVLLLATALAVAGTYLNMVWLNLVARAVRGDSLFAGPSQLLSRSLRHTMRFIALMLFLLLSLVVIVLPLSFAAALVAMIAAGVGQLLVSVLTLLVTWGMLWLGVHLFFVVGALVLSDEGVLGALRSSVRVVRRHFWSALAFILLSVLLSMGFQVVWNSLSQLSAAAHVTSIAGNAALGSAIAAAMFVFYRERVESVREQKPETRNQATT